MGPLTIGGREASVTASIKAEADGKTLRLPVAIDAKDLAGKAVVAFVTLSRDGTDVLCRDDIGDESQAVRFPAITTTFSNGDEGHEVCGDATLLLATDLAYENVLPKREYQAYVTPMDADTGEPILDDSGNVLTITHPRGHRRRFAAWSRMPTSCLATRTLPRARCTQRTRTERAQAW